MRDSVTPFRRSFRRSGFTLLEIMIVTAIIGFLFALAVPLWAKIRESSEVSRFTSDVRTFRQAIEIYAMEHGSELSDTSAGSLPDEFEGLINRGTFEAPASLGGHWTIFTTNEDGQERLAVGIDWSGDVRTPNSQALQRVDEAMDDGSLSSGDMRMSGATRFAYYMN